MSEQKNKNQQNEKTKLAEDIASKGKRVSRTYARFEVGFIRFFRFLSSFVDRFLFCNKYLFTSSFLLAIILVMALNFGDTKMLNNNQSAEILEDIKVQAIVNNEIYEVEGIPETVSALVIGEISDLQLIQSSNNLGVVADLSGLGEGTHAITLRPVNYSAKVQVRVDPSTAMVTISRKISKSYYFTYELINTDKADAMYQFSNPTFANDQVYVRASQETLDKIAVVKALIDVSGAIGDISQEALMVAYDQQGNRLAVDIIPERIAVNMLVSTPQKTVPVLIQPVGEIPDNKSISTITLDYKAITVYAPVAILEKIESVVIPLDVTKLTTNNLQGSAKVILPSGVKKVDIERVHFTITLGETTQKTLSGIKLEFIDFDSDSYRIAFNPLDANVEIILTGTKENIEAIQATQIRAYIDMSTISVGKQSVPIIIIGPDFLIKYSPVKGSIDIDVVEN